MPDENLKPHPSGWGDVTSESDAARACARAWMAHIDWLIKDRVRAALESAVLFGTDQDSLSNMRRYVRHSAEADRLAVRRHCLGRVYGHD